MAGIGKRGLYISCIPLCPLQLTFNQGCGAILAIELSDTLNCVSIEPLRRRGAKVEVQGELSGDFTADEIWS